MNAFDCFHTSIELLSAVYSSVGECEDGVALAEKYSSLLPTSLSANSSGKTSKRGGASSGLEDVRPVRLQESMSKKLFYIVR
jgi:hypothetical protein